MDTNIDHYSQVEIANLLKLDLQTISIDSLYNSIISKLRLLQTTEMDIDEKQDMLSFFKDCFIKLCQINDLRCTKNMILSIEEFIPLSFRDTQILYHILYPGSLPETTPQELSVNTYSTKYNRGIVNPLKRENIINTLIVSSKFRNKNNNGAYFEPSTNFLVDLTNGFNNVISLKVASLEFVNCFFNISKYYKNNTFEIETYKREIVTNARVNINRKPVTLPYGSYNIVSFDSFVTNFLNNDPVLSMVELNFDELKDSVNFRIKSTPPNPPGPGFQWEFNIYFDKHVKSRFIGIGWLLGFSKFDYLFTEDYILTANESLNIGFNGDRCLDMTGTKFFLLDVDDYNKNAPQVLQYNTDDETSFSGNNVMAKIPNTSLINEIIFEDSSDRIFKARRYFGPINLQKLQISILDEYGNVLDNNNGDVIVTFEIETLDSPYKNIVH
jgi:hypothetical protein